ncbi:MAG: methionyl-tRNA formyltransferase, partial [Planctomycetes bacterium]|nr:methionyl-tRNA formyltransferase [Planctomycetota bacterium]
PSALVASGAELLVWRALATSAEGGSNGAPGTILEAGPRWRVAAGDGALELLEVQVAGKRVLAAAEFLRGARQQPGQKLG